MRALSASSFRSTLLAVGYVIVVSGAACGQNVAVGHYDFEGKPESSSRSEYIPIPNLADNVVRAGTASVVSVRELMSVVCWDQLVDWCPLANRNLIQRRLSAVAAPLCDGSSGIAIVHDFDSDPLVRPQHSRFYINIEMGASGALADFNGFARYADRFGGGGGGSTGFFSGLGSEKHREQKANKAKHSGSELNPRDDGGFFGCSSRSPLLTKLILALLVGTGPIWFAMGGWVYDVRPKLGTAICLATVIVLTLLMVLLYNAAGGNCLR